MKYLIITLAVLAAALSTGCRDDNDGCTHLDTKCKDGSDWAMICNADQDWESTVDCSTYGKECRDGGCE